MILYDDKYNFLGMSSHTLGFLGYEDIGDFLSMQSDFATLLVNKEGYIYDFANFNWIDFVLYSGSANKTALVTLKSGQEAKIDLSIKEVHLAHEIAGINKLYSIKLISDNFHEISGIPKSEEKLEKALGGFSLSGLVSKQPEEKEIKKAEPLQEKVESNFLIDETPPSKIEKKEESFILNMDTNETSANIKESELLTAEPKITQEVEEDFKLDIFQQDVTPTQEEIGGFTIKTMDNDNTPVTTKEPESIEKEETSFLLKTQDDKTQNLNDTFSFNLLNEEPKLEVEKKKEETLDIFSTTNESSLEKVEPKVEENFVLGSLHTDSVEENISDKETISESGFKLDFLKTDLVQEEKEVIEKEEITAKQEITTENMQEKEQLLKPKDNSKIIKQIKRDIKEIDTVNKDETEPTFKLNIFNQEENKALDIPQMPQVEQPLMIKEVKEEKLELDKENREETKANTNFQTDGSLEKSEHPSFESTLKNLFNTDIEIDEVHQEDNEEKQHQKEEKMEIVEKPKSDIHQTTIALTSLGLDKEDEYELLNDFIQDANESIETIEQFIKTKDFDKINYALVKIKSSAEILNLNAIIEDAITIRQHCIKQENENIVKDVQKLKKNIHLLEEQLEATAL